MTREDSNGEEMTNIRIGYEDPENQGGPINLYTSKFHREQLNEFADKMGTGSRSEALRWAVQMGMHSIIQNDPRNSTDETEDGSGTTIRDLVPEGEENSVDLRDEFMEIIDDKILEIVESDPEIKRDGWEIYR